MGFPMLKLNDRFHEPIRLAVTPKSPADFELSFNAILLAITRGIIIVTNFLPLFSCVYQELVCPLETFRPYSFSRQEMPKVKTPLSSYKERSTSC